MKVCPSCGHENAPDEDFCEKCGVNLAAPQPPAEAQQQPTEAAAEVPQTTEQPPGGNPVAAAVDTPVIEMDPAAAEELKFHSAPPFPITISVAGITDPGLSGKNNEDAFAVDGLDYTKHNITTSLLAVTDGMGGGEGGEVLAKQAVYRLMSGLWYLMPTWDQMKDFDRLDFWRFANNQFSRFLCNQAATANTQVLGYGRAKKFKPGQYGSTLITAVVLSDLSLGRVLIRGLNMGDTRAYFVTDQGVEQLSTDQTVQGNPTSYLGAYEHIMACQWQREFWMNEEQFRSASLLLCSDGLWNMLSPDAIGKICREHDNAQATLAALVSAALSVEIPFGRTLQDPDDKKPVTTGDDNVTGALIQFSTQGAIETI